jgi:hypothetical protein
MGRGGRATALDSSGLTSDDFEGNLAVSGERSGFRFIGLRSSVLMTGGFKGAVEIWGWAETIPD